MNFNFLRGGSKGSESASSRKLNIPQNTQFPFKSSSALSTILSTKSIHPSIPVCQSLISFFREYQGKVQYVVSSDQYCHVGTENTRKQPRRQPVSEHSCVSASVAIRDPASSLFVSTKPIPFVLREISFRIESLGTQRSKSRQHLYPGTYLRP